MLILVRGVSAHLPKDKPLKGLADDQETPPMRYDDVARKYVIGDSFFHGEYVPLHVTKPSGDDYLYHKHPPDPAPVIVRSQHTDHVHADPPHPFHDFAEHAKQVSEELQRRSVDATKARNQLRDTEAAAQTIEQSLEDLNRHLQQHQHDSTPSTTTQLAQHAHDHLHDADTTSTHEHHTHHHHTKHKNRHDGEREQQIDNWLSYLAADNAKRLQDTAKRLRQPKLPPSAWQPTTHQDAASDPKPQRNSIPAYPQPSVPPTLVRPTPAPTPSQPAILPQASKIDTSPGLEHPKSLTGDEFESLGGADAHATVPQAGAYTPPGKQSPTTSGQHARGDSSHQPPPESSEQIFYNGQFYHISSHLVSNLLATAEQNDATLYVLPPSSAPTMPPHADLLHSFGVPPDKRKRASGVERRIRNPAILRLYRHFRSGDVKDDPTAMLDDVGGPPSSLPSLENIIYLTQIPVATRAPGYKTRPPRPPRDDTSYESSEEYDNGYKYARDVEPPKRRHRNHHAEAKLNGRQHRYNRHHRPHHHPHPDHPTRAHPHKMSARTKHREYAHHRPHHHNAHNHGHSPRHPRHNHQHHRRPPDAPVHAHPSQSTQQQAAQQTIVIKLLEKLSQTQEQLKLPPVAAPDADRDRDAHTASLLLPAAEEAPGEPTPGGTKTGAIVLGVLGALWLSYIGYLNNVSEE